MKKQQKRRLQNRTSSRRRNNAKTKKISPIRRKLTKKPKMAKPLPTLHENRTTPRMRQPRKNQLKK